MIGRKVGEAVAAASPGVPVAAPPALTALVLAAGAGQRFDPSGRRWKLVEPLPDGRTVVRASCENLLGHVDDVIRVQVSRVLVGDNPTEPLLYLSNGSSESAWIGFDPNSYGLSFLPAVQHAGRRTHDSCAEEARGRFPHHAPRK